MQLDVMTSGGDIDVLTGIAFGGRWWQMSLLPSQ